MPGGLLTDLYELNMAASYLRRSMTGQATFSLFVRRPGGPRRVRRRAAAGACGLTRVTHGVGRPRKHGSDRFECKNPATWGDPDQELSRHDERYGQVSVMSWGGLHPKLACRGRFAGFAGPPVIKCHLIRVTVEHGYRFAKTALGWDKATLREPDQVSRWTWLILCGLTQLRLARPIAEDHRQRWERRRKPGTLTPGRVRRDFGRLAALAGTPASPPKPSRAGPGRPKGRTSTPAPRHPVLKRAALRHVTG